MPFKELHIKTNIFKKKILGQKNKNENSIFISIYNYHFDLLIIAAEGKGSPLDTIRYLF
jgi:hypothetical protein